MERNEKGCKMDVDSVDERWPSRSFDRQPVRKRQDGRRRPRKEQCGWRRLWTVKVYKIKKYVFLKFFVDHCLFLGRRQAALFITPY